MVVKFFPNLTSSIILDIFSLNFRLQLIIFKELFFEQITKAGNFLFL
jgi:hypothetical protein